MKHEGDSDMNDNQSPWNKPKENCESCRSKKGFRLSKPQDC